MLSPNSGRPRPKYFAAAARAGRVPLMKWGEGPIMPQVVRAQRSIIAPRRSSSCRVRGMTKDNPTRSPLVGEMYVISSRSPGSCCRSYSAAMARTPLARPGWVVTSLMRSPRSQISRSCSCRPLMYSAPVRAGMANSLRDRIVLLELHVLGRGRIRIALDEPRRGDLDARSHTPDEALLRSEEHTSELQSPCNLVCRLLLEKKK